MFCSKCGFEMKDGERVCQKCGAPAEKAPSETPCVLKTYDNMAYGVGALTKFTLKVSQCSFAFCSDQIDIFKTKTSTTLLFGAVGGAIAGAVAAANYAKNAGASIHSGAAVSIPYSAIARYAGGTFVTNRSVILYLKDGSAYTLLVNVAQGEILNILRNQCGF